MIKTKKDLKEYLTYESEKYFKRKYKLKDLLFRFGEVRQLFYINYLLRKAEYFLNKKKRIRFLWFNHLLVKHTSKYCMCIPLNVIGKGFKMAHFGPIMINAKSIGQDFRIHRGVEIVAGGTNDLVPTIGNNVICFVSSTISGGIVLGDNTVVAANSCVNKSFEEGNCLIGGVPAKILKNNITHEELFKECKWMKDKINNK